MCCLPWHSFTVNERKVYHILTLTPIHRGEGAPSALLYPGMTRGASGADARRELSDPSQEVDPGRSLVFCK